MVQMMHSGSGVFLVSSSTVCKKKFYLNTSHVGNVGTSKSAIFLNTLYLRSFKDNVKKTMARILAELHW